MKLGAAQHADPGERARRQHEKCKTLSVEVEVRRTRCLAVSDRGWFDCLKRSGGSRDEHHATTAWMVPEPRRYDPVAVVCAYPFGKPRGISQGTEAPVVATNRLDGPPIFPGDRNQPVGPCMPAPRGGHWGRYPEGSMRSRSRVGEV